ncbi:MAG: SRPBCC domain-containing protein [Thalassospira sp.]|uniref:SRPBCC family protein n=1 Tax=Thalassospira sp. TaxID=1912094 RepID=UPI0032EECAF1
MERQKPSLTIRRRLAAPPATVFAAWTDGQKLAQWWTPHDCEMIDANVDVRVGGGFRIRFKEPGQDGEIHDVSGTYDAVETDRKLSFSWQWITMPERVSHVTVTLAPDANGAATILVLHHEQFADQAARDGHEGGWNSTLDKLETFCASIT